jgi:hypothetical protein
MTRIMDEIAIRPWCVKAQYPGLEPFVAGTVTLPLGARHDEIMDALDAMLKRILPQGYVMLEPLCGSIFFNECEPD